MPDALKTEIIERTLARQTIVGPLLPVDRFKAVIDAGTLMGRAECQSRTKGSGTYTMQIAFLAPFPGANPRWMVGDCGCRAGAKGCRHALQLDCHANLPLVSPYLQSGAEIFAAYCSGQCPQCGQKPKTFGLLALCHVRLYVSGRGYVAFEQCAQCGWGKVA